MALMIDARHLKYSVRAADQAWELVLKEDKRLMELEALLSISTVNPVDREVVKIQAEAVRKAKDVYSFLKDTVVMELRTAILKAELKAPSY
jgi:hypothetical protein